MKLQSHILREQLLRLAEPEYKEFSDRLLPGVNNLLGVRLPKLRNLAKEIARGDWQQYLLTASDEYFEEIMLQGMVIGCVEENASQKLNLAKAFIPKIDNWSVCDSFCSGFKVAREEPLAVWHFINPYLNSANCYEVRFAVVMLLRYYIDKTYIERVLMILTAIEHTDYYVKMAVAWALAECYAKFPQLTLPYLCAEQLPAATYQKALQKIIESRQVTQSDKTVIRQLRRQVRL